MRFVIVTGLSGAGKSQAVKHLEDFGYFCVDNLPPSLIPKFVELCHQTKGKIDKIALVVDIRGGLFFDDVFTSLDTMEELGYKCEILYLEASDQALVKRFKETRRAHPLSLEGSIIDGVIKEKEKLQQLRKMATNTIDTTKLIPSQLKEVLRSSYLEGKETNNMMISIITFGFKHGVPLDADLVFDVRFLPNPYYIEELRDFTGDDQRVRDYVMNSSVSVEFTEKLYDMMDFLIPQYIKEGKNQLVIAIGCTGGRHRSVTIANLLYQRMKEKGYRVITNHRDSTLVKERKR
ncbi:RNase adapter RapZ [Alkaliphilus transvaalensis]|uniref:RNase adapter RapZ n=1 Tax=Alkaliphilus transvaalensis TaxID=114628 RepID=UPI00047AC597|nr:RNase adapter RapZ [Alkaliphilus transvaalensis]